MLVFSVPQQAELSVYFLQGLTTHNIAMATEVHVSSVQKLADKELEEKLGANAIFDAKQATDDEHAQTLMQALKENRKAVIWSVLISMTIVMEG